MDPRKLTELLRATIDPTQQKQAEEQLNQVNLTATFIIALAQVSKRGKKASISFAGAQDNWFCPWTSSDHHGQ